MADVAPLPPTGTPSTELVDQTSGREILGAGFAVGMVAAIVGIAVTIGTTFIAFVAGEAPSPGSVAIIGAPHPTLFKLVIPAGLLAFLCTIIMLARRRFSRPIDQGAAGLVAVLVGLVALGYGFLRWA